LKNIKITALRSVNNAGSPSCGQAIPEMAIMPFQGWPALRALKGLAWQTQEKLQGVHGHPIPVTIRPCLVQTRPLSHIPCPYGQLQIYRFVVIMICNFINLSTPWNDDISDFRVTRKVSDEPKGKDRTGIAAALILMVLGKSREEIREDFNLSERGLYTIRSGLEIEGQVRRMVRSDHDWKWMVRSGCLWSTLNNMKVGFWRSSQDCIKWSNPMLNEWDRNNIEI
jgi:hypothetical protein